MATSADRPLSSPRLALLVCGLLMIGWLLASASSPGMASARPSASGPWVVKDYGQGKAVVAGYATRRDQTLRGLIRAWGPPARLARKGGTAGRGCFATWKVPAARAELANYGFMPKGASTCSPRYGRVQLIHTIGPLWRTDRGLEIGDENAAVIAAYPDAVDDTVGSNTWWLLRPYETICLGECDTDTVNVSAVVAEMPSTRISRFRVFVGGAGE